MRLNEIKAAEDYRYAGNCVHSHMEPGLRAMMDDATEVSHRVLVAAVGRDKVAAAFPGFDWSRAPRDLTMARDHAVSYFKSTFMGRPCYYIRESGIEHVFVDASAPAPAARQPRTNASWIVAADGAISKLSAGNTRGPFSMRVLRPGMAECSQSEAATKASAAALAKWLGDNSITTVVEDGDEQPVHELLDWLAGVD